jgi:hypothetical protein
LQFVELEVPQMAQAQLIDTHSTGGFLSSLVWMMLEYLRSLIFGSAKV